MAPTPSAKYNVATPSSLAMSTTSSASSSGMWTALEPARSRSKLAPKTRTGSSEKSAFWELGDVDETPSLVEARCSLSTGKAEVGCEPQRIQAAKTGPKAALICRRESTRSRESSPNAAPGLKGEVEVKKYASWSSRGRESHYSSAAEFGRPGRRRS
eukprot:scaffold8389_cov267-Pinguiococcus_pyrenoidosus.AAC.3